MKASDMAACGECSFHINCCSFAAVSAFGVVVQPF